MARATMGAGEFRTEVFKSNAGEEKPDAIISSLTRISEQRPAFETPVALDVMRRVIAQPARPRDYVEQRQVSATAIGDSSCPNNSSKVPQRFGKLDRARSVFGSSDGGRRTDRRFLSPVDDSRRVRS